MTTLECQILIIPAYNPPSDNAFVIPMWLLGALCPFCIPRDSQGPWQARMTPKPGIPSPKNDLQLPDAVMILCRTGFGL